MNGVDSVGVNKSIDYMQKTQMEIKDKLNIAKNENSFSIALGDNVAATLSISSSGVAQAERAERESILKNSIVQLECGYKKFDLSDEEACILKSFRLEEYYGIRDKMKNEDSDSYNALLKAEKTAAQDSDSSATFKVYAKAYNWAYGDVFDRIHKENPNVDIYVRSQGTPENHNFQMRNSRISLVISTDEIKLLQSKKESDKDAQDALWNTILEKIRA